MTNREDGPSEKSESIHQKCSPEQIRQAKEPHSDRYPNEPPKQEEEAIRKRGLTNTIVAVVRYFGGKELGASGLYKAYSRTTLDTLSAASYYIMEECAVYEFKFSYNEFAKVGAYLRDNNYPALRIEYLDIVRAEIAIPVSKEQFVFSELKMMLNGKVINNKLRTAYFRFDPPKDKKGK